MYFIISATCEDEGVRMDVAEDEAGALQHVHNALASGAGFAMNEGFPLVFRGSRIGVETSLVSLEKKNQMQMPLAPGAAEIDPSAMMDEFPADEDE